MAFICGRCLFPVSNVFMMVLLFSWLLDARNQLLHMHTGLFISGAICRTLEKKAHTSIAARINTSTDMARCSLVLLTRLPEKILK